MFELEIGKRKEKEGKQTRPNPNPISGAHQPNPAGPTLSLSFPQPATHSSRGPNRCPRPSQPRSACSTCVRWLSALSRTRPARPAPHARASRAPLTERPHPSAPTCQPAQRPRPSLPAASTAPRVRVIPFLTQRPRLARRNSRRAFLPGRGRRDIRRPPLNL